MSPSRIALPKNRAAASRAAAVLDDARWQSVASRDARADGRFFYAVATTGVYCRPSCAARTPRPENVSFYATRREAEAAGYRACRRCRPEAPPRARREEALVAELCRRLGAETPPSWVELARDAGVSPFHLHRLFKRVTGVTPRAYASRLREARVREALGPARTVTEALHHAGYASASRFYDRARRSFGMAPATYRAGGASERIRFATTQSTLGALLVATTERGLCAISLGEDPKALVRELHDRFPRASIEPAGAEFSKTLKAVVRLMGAPERGLSLPMDVRGTAFQERVWQALAAIPPGETLSYQELARHVGSPRAVRAVASACAANPLAVAVPCHRAVRTDGALAGYRWGLERKRELLERERARASRSPGLDLRTDETGPPPARRRRAARR